MGDRSVVLVAPRYLVAVLALLLLTAAGALLSARHGGRHETLQGSGIAATQSRSVAPFDAVELAGSNTITITIGRPQRVLVHADTNLLRHVTTTVRAGRLVVGNTPGSFAAVMPMSVEVTVPSIAGLTLSGSGSIAADGGPARTLTAVVAGSGEIRADGIPARDVRAVISGSGRIVVTATQRLDASIQGSGSVMYTGNPAHVTTNVAGSGSATPF